MQNYANTLLRGCPSFHSREVRVPVLLPSKYWCDVFGYWSFLSASHEKNRVTKLEGTSGGCVVCSPTKSRANFDEVPGGSVQSSFECL